MTTKVIKKVSPDAKIEARLTIESSIKLDLLTILFWMVKKKLVLGVAAVRVN